MAVMPILRFDREDLEPLQMLKGNVRFAATKALTKTAKDAQEALKAEAPSVFHLRNSWVPRGIQIEVATPSNLNAKAGSIDKYMARHVVGEKKSAAHALSIRRHRDGDPDKPPTFWLDRGAMGRRAKDLIGRFKVKTASSEAPIATLSGGNVQRAVLARELTDPVDLLIVVNPCFGLDFAAVSEIRARIVSARNAGAAVLLISEDLDAILELSDRIVVMSEGRLVYEVPAAQAEIGVIGRHMAGHHNITRMKSRLWVVR